MQTSRTLLVYGLHFFLSCWTVRGAIFVPEKAIGFEKCNPGQNNPSQCPGNSTCKQANIEYYCQCNSGFYNDKDRTQITYPGGVCLVICKKDERPPSCACKAGFAPKLQENGLYSCTDICKDDSDCPPRATCKAEHCYCKEGCKKQQGNVCITLVKLDDTCSDPVTTRHSLLTSNANIGATSAYMQPESPTTQPVLNYTTSPVLTSNMNTHQMTEETHYIPFTLTAEDVTPHSIPQKTSKEPGVPTSQPVIDRCETKSRTEEQLEECERSNNKDPICTFLKSIVNIKDDACERNDTNTSTSVVQKVASQITELLNQTTLTNLEFSDLRTVVIAVIENVETSLLETFSADPRNQQINTSEIEAQMKVSHDHCGRRPSIILNVYGNQMEVPCSLVNVENGGAMLISYKGLNSKLNGSILAALGDSGYMATAEVLSPVVSGTITSPSTKNLDPPVKFSLKHLMAVKPDYRERCMFWDTQKEVWSTYGCETHRSERENSTLCVCTHLSTFALIMAPKEIQVDAGLRLISVIGLSISLVCLCLSLLTFLLCRSLRSAHTSILTVLCGCLFLGQLLVLVGLEQTGNKILCAVIAGSLQFFFLCAFCWMSLESILLFLTVRNLRAMNYMSSQRSHFPYVCLIGFGIPAIIMIVSASVYPDKYGDETHCWLKISHVWSFLGPVCLFICVNFILLILTFWLLRKKLASLNSNVSTLKHTRLLTFKALSQLFILGCTWIIGLFQFGSGSTVVSYIFTICNSLQGLYIFLVHCLLNHQVQEEYRRGFRRLYSKKSMSDSVSGSTVPMTTRPSQTSEISKDVVCSLEKQKD